MGRALKRSYCNYMDSPKPRRSYPTVAFLRNQRQRGRVPEKEYDESSDPTSRFFGARASLGRSCKESLSSGRGSFIRSGDIRGSNRVPREAQSEGVDGKLPASIPLTLGANPRVAHIDVSRYFYLRTELRTSRYLVLIARCQTDTGT